MFDKVFESLRKATEETVRLQQEMVKKWVSLWPGAPNSPELFTGQVQQFQKRWTETVNEVLKKQRETAQVQFEVGLKNIDKAFQLYDVKSAEELRTKLSQFYAQRTLLKAAVSPGKVADAIYVLCTDRLALTTGHVVPVDAGLPEAFLR